MPEVESREQLQAELAGLDALELAEQTRIGRARRIWTMLWPKVAAVSIALFLWQCVVWSGWKKEYVLPGPRRVFPVLRDLITSGKLQDAVVQTMERAVKGYALALVIGVLVGSAVANSKILRSAFGSFITGLQTMPSVVWFPMAIILFRLTEGAIFFVVVLGAAPSIANGLISGIDQVPPLYLRAGRALGAKGLTFYRRVMLPAALPGFVGGLKQGWAFAWRSLMAGELLVIIPGHTSIGTLMQNAKDVSDTNELIASMIVVLLIGIAVDALVFGRLQRAVNRRWGLVAT
ncbi:MAG: sulfonate transport system permease protein [Acidimicrobiaceae bacterium]|jgi:NitT/TauT family transport system permease protein